MSTLYFIRHGQASFGKENYDRLSERGIMQASLLGRHFMLTGVTFDVIYTGTLERQIGTANEILRLSGEKGLNAPRMYLNDAFNEYDSRAVLTTLVPLLLTEDPSLKYDVDRLFSSRTSFQKIFELSMLRWISGNHPGELLPYRSFRDAVHGGINEIMKRFGRGKNVAIVTSGGPIAAAVMMALHISDDDSMRLTWQIINTSVSRFKCTEDRFSLMSFNDVCHLELTGDRGLITYR